MAKKAKKWNFEQTLAKLWASGFEQVLTIEGYPARGAYVASKYGVAVVLGAGVESVPRILEGPGWRVGNRIARLLDRGYQKFFQTVDFEIPATAAQLQAIHRFTEELRQVTGEISLYNESLGTISELYQYDRLQGREAEEPEAVRPWTEGAEETQD